MTLLKPDEGDNIPKQGAILVNNPPSQVPAPIPTPEQPTQLNSAKKKDNLINMIVVKYFDGKPYIGKIASYRKPYYKVKYDDGDREEYTKEEVEKLLLIGKKVVNYFDGKPYHGVIKSYKYPYYKVLYEDGDEEEYTKVECRRFCSNSNDLNLQ